MKKIFGWRNYILIYLFVLLVYNLLLLRFPLTHVFGYEFSVLNSVLIVLLGGIYSISFYKNLFVKEKQFFTKELYKSLFLFLLIPFCVSVVNSVINGFCSFYDGVLFYLIITLPSILIAGSLAMISVVYFKRFKIIFLFVLYIGILLIIAAEIYFNPQVYVYNPIIVFFPGTVYDEGIAITWKLILYRAFNILFFSIALFYSVKILKNRKKNRKLFFTNYLLLFPILFYLFSPDLGYSTTKESLTRDLNKSVETEHFIIHFDKRIEEKRLKLIVLNHEYYYRELTSYLNCNPIEKINSFIFYDDNQKGKLFGSKNADVAKPWLNQIYITQDSWKNTLKHELAHCFSALFGAGFLKLASGWNPGLIEGIAEAADGQFDENTIHYMAALAYKSNYQVNLNHLFTKIGFFSQASTISYIYAGSFVQYLVENFGIEKFKKYYSSGDFTETYRIELSNVLKDYYSFLTEIKNDFHEDEAHFYFGRKSIFQKVCPRAISEILTIGWEQYHNFNYVGARISFKKVLELSNSYSALVGLVKSFEKQDSIVEAIDVLSRSLDEYKNTSYYYNLEVIQADLYASAYKFTSADSIYKKITYEFPSRGLYYLSIMRNSLVDKNKIKNYLEGSSFDRYSILIDLNKVRFDYASLPVLINLSQELDENISIFKNKLNNIFIVNNYISSYAAFKLSQYFLDNFDFENARKYSGLSLKYNRDKNFNAILKENTNKIDWFSKNGDLLLEKIHIVINN